jgi:DNA-binding NtrC family response regulator
LSLPTLVVCEPDSEKSHQIEALVTSQPDLALIETVSRQSASEEICNRSAKLVWLELDPDPEQAVLLLEALKDKYPSTHFLVSYAVLDAGLVKATMQKGAFDYLDSESWDDQLSDVIARLMAKEKAIEEAKAKITPAAATSDPFTDTADRIPVYNEAINKMRARQEAATRPEVKEGLPAWLIPSLALILLAILVALQIGH